MKGVGSPPSPPTPSLPQALPRTPATILMLKNQRELFGPESSYSERTSGSTLRLPLILSMIPSKGGALTIHLCSSLLLCLVRSCSLCLFFIFLFPYSFSNNIRFSYFTVLFLLFFIFWVFSPSQCALFHSVLFHSLPSIEYDFVSHCSLFIISSQLV